MLSEIISIAIESTKERSIKENCLCSRGGIYWILNSRIILEINITVNKNNIETQSIINLMGILKVSNEIKGNSKEIKNEFIIMKIARKRMGRENISIRMLWKKI